MPRVVVSVRRRGEAAETDFEVPTDVGAEELLERLAGTLGEPAGTGALELRAVSLGRALRPGETLADAGLWDGATLVLARSTDPPEAGSRSGGALALATGPTKLAVVPIPEPPVLAPPVTEEAPRSLVPFVVLGAVLLALVGSGIVWIARGRDATAPVAAPSATVVAAQPTPAPTTPPASAPVAQPTASSTALAQAAPDDETAWRELLARLDLVWDVDWPASIGLLQAFHAQYPTRTAATDKLYAALVEYGRTLHDAGAATAAAEAFDQALRLQPQRMEARAELAALAPPPTAMPEPMPDAAAPPVSVSAAPIVGPPAAVPAAVAPVPPPGPADTPPAPVAPGCDVRSSDSACPLADGSSLQDAIDVPDGRHFYWFGVPVPGLQLRVEASGPACPCTLLLYSDLVDNGSTPIDSASAADAGPTVLNRFMSEPGPYLIELMPNQDGSSPDALYTLVLGLTVPPPRPEPVAAVAVEHAPPSPPPAVPPPALVLVPPVVARSASQGNDRLRAAGLAPQLDVVDRYSPGGEGTIAAQDPPAGTPMPPGSSVTLLVASGNVVVPAVVGLAEQDAWAALHDAGLAIDIRRAPRSNVAAGRAARVDPSAGAVVPAGATIVLTISQGG